MNNPPITRAQLVLRNHLLDEDGKVFHGPRLHPCTCECGLAAHAGKLNTGACRTCRCARYRHDTGWQLAYDAIDAERSTLMRDMREYDKRERASQLTDRPKLPGQWSLGPSDTGTCRRAIWYRNMPPAGLVRAWSDDGPALMGGLIHDAAVDRLKALYPWQEFEQWVKVKGLDREGRLDRWDEVMGVLEDLKTTGDYATKVVEEDGARVSDWEQVSLYALAKEEEGHKVRTLKLTYIERKSGRDQPFSAPYDREFALNARQKLLDIAGALDLVHAETEAKRAQTGDPDAWVDPESLELLPRDRSGPSTDEICKRCPFRRHCWSLDEAEEHGRSGESWTALGADPEVTAEATIWTLKNAREAADLARQTGKLKDEAEAVVQGLRPGRYGLRGEFTVYEQDHGNRPQPKAYAEALVKNAALPPEEQQDPAEIEMPLGDPSVKTHVKKTAAKTLTQEAKLRGEDTPLPKPEPQSGGAA